MSSGFALLFPRTAPLPVFLREALLYLPGLAVYQPCEARLSAGLPAWCRSHLEVLAPCPCSPEAAARFRAMLRDLASHKEAYAGAFRQAWAGGGADGDGDAGWQLRSRIAHPDAPGPAGQDPLWSARLLLALAELQDEEEAAAAAALAKVAAQEERLRTLLAGEDSDGERLPWPAGEAMVPPPPPPGLAARIRSWARLQAASIPERPRLLVTDIPAAFELLAERYQSRTGRAPAGLGSLPLPALAALADGEYAGRRQRFQAATVTARAALAAVLTGASAGPLPEADAWVTALEEAFGTGPRAELAVYSLAGSSLASLLAEGPLQDEGPSPGPGAPMIVVRREGWIGG
ncbi:MAG: hypothetical protein AB1634_10690 [Thermodesulfobacteriota bacterium]